jgi:preprotein translocase subunit SecE
MRMTSTRSDSSDVNSSQNAPSTPTSDDAPGTGSKNPFLAIGLFVRQVIAELRKVVVPTRTELIVYSFTVLVFVVVMIMLIFGLDAAFSWLARTAFMNPDAGL